MHIPGLCTLHPLIPLMHMLISSFSAASREGVTQSCTRIITFQQGTHSHGSEQGSEKVHQETLSPCSQDPPCINMHPNDFEDVDTIRRGS